MTPNAKASRDAVAPGATGSRGGGLGPVKQSAPRRDIALVDPGIGPLLHLTDPLIRAVRYVQAGVGRPQPLRRAGGPVHSTDTPI